MSVKQLLTTGMLFQASQHANVDGAGTCWLGIKISNGCVDELYCILWAAMFHDAFAWASSVVLLQSAAVWVKEQCQAHFPRANSASQLCRHAEARVHQLVLEQVGAVQICIRFLVLAPAHDGPAQRHLPDNQ